jgi:Domain of unknown function (DUF5666)
MKTTLSIVAATAALAAGAVATTAGATMPAASPSAASAAATRHLEGRVTAIDRSARAFTVRDAERGALKVKVTASTTFERTSFAALRVGSKVDVRAAKVDGSWRATKVERGVAAANHDAGDDHGGGRHGGNDDPAGHR